MTNPMGTGVGAWADLVALDAEQLAHAPTTMSLGAAATLPLAGLTGLRAWNTLVLSPDDRVLVTGAAGAIGGLVVQLAANAGIQVDGLVSRPSYVNLVRRLGAGFVTTDPTALPTNTYDAIVDTIALPSKGVDVRPFVTEKGQYVATGINDSQIPGGHSPSASRMTRRAQSSGQAGRRRHPQAPRRRALRPAPDPRRPRTRRGRRTPRQGGARLLNTTVRPDRAHGATDMSKKSKRSPDEPRISDITFQEFYGAMVEREAAREYLGDESATPFMADRRAILTTDRLPGIDGANPLRDRLDWTPLERTEYPYEAAPRRLCCLRYLLDDRSDDCARPVRSSHSTRRSRSSSSGMVPVGAPGASAEQKAIERGLQRP